MNSYCVVGFVASSVERKNHVALHLTCAIGLRGLGGESLLGWTGPSWRNGLLVGVLGGQPRYPRHSSSVCKRRSNVVN